MRHSRFHESRFFYSLRQEQSDTVGVFSAVAKAAKKRRQIVERRPMIDSLAHWYAVYTCANQEKRVAERLNALGVEHYLPLYSSARRWKDRRVRLQLALFPSYLFVYLLLSNRLTVLQIPGVVNLVGFKGVHIPIPDGEIAKVRELLLHGYVAEPHRYLAVGRRVRVVNGPLQGVEGVVLNRKNRQRFVISFEAIQRSISVEVAGFDLEPAGRQSLDGFTPVRV
jgi:transcription antitermination factor NusG